MRQARTAGAGQALQADPLVISGRRARRRPRSRRRAVENVRARAVADDRARPVRLLCDRHPSTHTHGRDHRRRAIVRQQHPRGWLERHLCCMGRRRTVDWWLERSIWTQVGGGGVWPHWECGHAGRCLRPQRARARRRPGVGWTGTGRHRRAGLLADSGVPVAGSVERAVDEAQCVVGGGCRHDRHAPLVRLAVAGRAGGARRILRGVDAAGGGIGRRVAHLSRRLGPP